MPTKTRKRRTKKSSSGSRHRASWRGQLRFGLVTFGVQAVNAHVPSKGAISFHQLHEDCGRRIHYQKVCPVHGEVENDEIVSAYEYGKGKYVEVSDEELDQLRTEKERALTIDTFIEPDQIDPVYYDGRMYFLVPDGESAFEPYAIFLAALEQEQRYGVGQVVFSGKEQVVVVRPYGEVLHMALLNYEAEMRTAEQVAPSLPKRDGEARKIKLARQIIDQWTEGQFDFSDYVDRTLEKTQALIDAKIKGHEVVKPEEDEEEPDVINLMDALKKSMQHTGRKRKTASRGKAKAHRNGKAQHNGADHSHRRKAR
jgi:DNA end-binding protein Ku